MESQEKKSKVNPQKRENPRIRQIRYMPDAERRRMAAAIIAQAVLAQAGRLCDEEPETEMEGGHDQP